MEHFVANVRPAARILNIDCCDMLKHINKSNLLKSQKHFRCIAPLEQQFESAFAYY